MLPVDEHKPVFGTASVHPYGDMSESLPAPKGQLRQNTWAVVGFVTNPRQYLSNPLSLTSQPLSFIAQLDMTLAVQMKIISDIEACPACGSENLQRVPRSGREDWVFDRVYVCANCLERSGRVPPGKTTLRARVMNLFKLI